MKKFISNLMKRKKTFLGIILAIVIGLVITISAWRIMAILSFLIIEIPFRSRSPELEELFYGMSSPQAHRAIFRAITSSVMAAG
jgi:hypothetical protein